MGRASNIQTVTIGNSATRVLDQSLSRVAIIFPPAQSSTVYTLGTDDGVSLGAGLNVKPDGPPLVITVEEFGNAARWTWWAIAASSITIGILQTIQTPYDEPTAVGGGRQ